MSEDLTSYRENKHLALSAYFFRLPVPVLIMCLYSVRCLLASCWWLKMHTNSIFKKICLHFSHSVYLFIYLFCSLFICFTLQYCIGFAIHWHPPRVSMSSQTWTPSHLPPHIISLGHPHAPAPSILYPASNIDGRFVSYMIVYHTWFSKLPPS